MKDKEVWRDIVGWEGLYKISNIGRILSIGRPGRKGAREGARIMKPSRDRKGYLRIQFCRNGVHRSAKVHHLVLEAFVGKRPDGYQVNHKNGRTGDNHLENLEYCTPHENSLHAFRHLHRISNLTGERHWSSKLTQNEVKAIRLLYESGKYTQKKLAIMFGVKQPAISKIVLCQRWNHL